MIKCTRCIRVGTACLQASPRAGINLDPSPIPPLTIVVTLNVSIQSWELFNGG